MTIAQRIGRESAGIEAKRRAAEFSTYAHALMAGVANHAAPADYAQETHASRAVVECLKADVTGATGNDASWAAPLGEYQAMVSGFLGTVATSACFDAILPDCLPGRLHSSFGVITLDASAYVNLQGSAKKLSQLQLASATLVERKVAAMVVLSNDVVRLSSGAVELVGRSLRSSVASVTDESFVDGLVAAATPGVTASGTDASGVFDDLRAVFDTVATGDDSRLHIIVSPTTANFLALLATSSGAAAFPAMSPLGGQIAGVPVHISTHADANMIVIDASAIVAASETINLRATSAASLEMDTAPGASISSGSPEAPAAATGKVVCLFQADSVALLAERFFGFEIIRAAGVAVLDAGAWPASGSPLV